MSHTHTPNNYHTLHIGLGDNSIYRIHCIIYWSANIITMAKYCLTAISYNNLCAVKNTITLNALCSQKKDQKCHLFKK